eukprot:976263-Prymnesium_polylepis.1
MSPAGHEPNVPRHASPPFTCQCTGPRATFFRRALNASWRGRPRGQRRRRWSRPLWARSADRAALEPPRVLPGRTAGCSAVVRGGVVILKSHNRANLTTPPLRTSIRDVPKTPKMSVWVHRGHTH